MVKKEVIEPGGILRRLEESVKELLSKKGSSEVTMGGVSFKDQLATEAWASVLGDQEVISYGYDMVVQLLALSSSLTTSSGVTKATSDAMKAGYSSTTAVDTTSSFSLPYPETILKPSTMAQYTSRGGLTFTSAFSSPGAYGGDAEYSSEAQFLSTLSNNHDQNQRSIDA